MSYFLLSDSTSSILGSTSPLIKKAERQAFVDASALLSRANAIAADASTEINAARLEAEREGYAAGLAAAETETELAMQGFAESIARIEQHHVAQVAEAAYAAAVAIIGDFKDEALVARLVLQVLAKQKDSSGLSVHVAPQWQPKLSGRFGDLPVIASATLGPTECHVKTANGTIIASLPVQLGVLRERWGVPEVEPRE